MSDFDDGRAEHELNEWGRNVSRTFESVSVLQGQVAIFDRIHRAFGSRR